MMMETMTMRHRSGRSKEEELLAGRAGPASGHGDGGAS